MIEREIEEKLNFAHQRLDRAIEAMAPKHRGGEWQELQAASSAVYALEREWAAAKGEQYAVPIDFPVEWDIGAPLPHLVSSDDRTFLMFHVRERDPDWDGTYVTVKSPSDKAAVPLALVEFTRCASVKMGKPNDEVHQGHPLYGRGLEGYTAQRVENSPWLAELEAVNKIHAGYRPERWQKLKHYILWFHDSTFECVAETFTVEVYRENMTEMLNRICSRILR